MKLTSEVLCAALQLRLDWHFGQARPIASLTRRPSPYQSSFDLEELDVVLADGTTLALLLKGLSRQSMQAEIRDVKPAFLYEPRREPETYRVLLASADLDTAICYGSFVTSPDFCSAGVSPAPFPPAFSGPGGMGNEGHEDDEGHKGHWLVLERVEGAPLYEYGARSIWEAAARWLARLHALSYCRPHLPAQSTTLLCYDAAFYATWRQRAQANLAVRVARGECAPRDVDMLLVAHAWATQHLLTLPAAWIHGEFYASNVLIQCAEDQNAGTPHSHRQAVDADAQLRVCPVDWEMSAVGPGLMDLAALIAGEWQAEDRLCLIDAYYTTLAPMVAAERRDLPRSNPPIYEDYDLFTAHLACCRLHMAVQWLGWQDSATGHWQPPPEQARDWFGEALALIDELP